MNKKYVIKDHNSGCFINLSEGIVNMRKFKFATEGSQYDSEEEADKIIDMLPSGVYEVVKIYVK